MSVSGIMSEAIANGIMSEMEWSGIMSRRRHHAAKPLIPYYLPISVAHSTQLSLFFALF